MKTTVVAETLERLISYNYTGNNVVSTEKRNIHKWSMLLGHATKSIRCIVYIEIDVYWGHIVDSAYLHHHSCCRACY